MQKLIAAVIIVGGIILGTLSMAGWGRAEAKLPANVSQVQTPIGHEHPTDGVALNIRGWNITDAPSCPIATTFRNLQTYVGPPVGSFTGMSQDFLFARIICIPTNGPGEQAILDDLGRQELLLRGLTEEADAEPDPVVHQWMLEALHTGFDPRQVAGRLVSPIICTQETPKTCSQYADKAVLSWTPGAHARAHLEPVGCLLNQVCYRAMSEQVIIRPARPASIPMLVVAVLMLLAGVAVLLFRNRDVTRGPGIA